MFTQKVSSVKLLHRKVSILHSFWENLHWTEKIYTEIAGGAGDKYQVWELGLNFFELVEHWKRSKNVKSNKKFKVKNIYFQTKL